MADSDPQERRLTQSSLEDLWDSYVMCQIRIEATILALDELLEYREKESQDVPN
jgi:hypothetical protein